jgi:hypothetical protein
LRIQESIKTLPRTPESPPEIGFLDAIFISEEIISSGCLDGERDIQSPVIN